MLVSVNKIAAALLLGGVVLGLQSPAVAENWPTRTITAVIPFAAGNASDLSARIVFDQVSKQLGQPIVIENRPGAGGTIGVGYAARATPDGYTILYHSASLAAAYVTHKTLPYDTLTDFTPVVSVGVQPSVLVTAPSKGFKSAADLVAAAKARPGAMNYASAGIGSASHLAAEKFNVAAGIKAQHVPFKGPVEALSEVMAGRIDYYFLPIAPALQLIANGQVLALAVSSNKRAPALPEIPTTAEIGYPQAAYAFWNGIFVPAKTPQEIVDHLYKETRKALADDGVKARLAKLSVDGLPMTQPEFAAYYKADVLETDALAKSAGIEKQ